MTVGPATSTLSRPEPTRTPRSVRAVPKPRPAPLVTGRVAQRLAQAQGFAFDDIRCDLEAADALGTGQLVDRRRDEHIRQALRLVRLSRQDRPNAESYLALASGHLHEAIRLDRIVDEHEARAERQVAASIEAGRAVVGAHEELLTGRTP